MKLQHVNKTHKIDLTSLYDLFREPDMDLTSSCRSSKKTSCSANGMMFVYDWLFPIQNREQEFEIETRKNRGVQGLFPLFLELGIRASEDC